MADRVHVRPGGDEGRFSTSSPLVCVSMTVVFLCGGFFGGNLVFFIVLDFKIVFSFLSRTNDDYDRA